MILSRKRTYVKVLSRILSLGGRISTFELLRVVLSIVRWFRGLGSCSVTEESWLISHTWPTEMIYYI